MCFMLLVTGSCRSNNKQSEAVCLCVRLCICVLTRVAQIITAIRQDEMREKNEFLD